MKLKLVLALIMAISSVQAAGQCMKDTDCKGDRICSSSGVCTSPKTDPKRVGPVASPSTRPQTKTENEAACDLLYVGLVHNTSYDSSDVQMRVLGVGREKVSVVAQARGSDDHFSEWSCLSFAKMTGKVR
jgi:hypothetical protein